MDLERTPLLTDLYELTMLQTYFEHGMVERAVFEFFVRKRPRRPFYVAAGLEQALEWLQGLRFGDAELAWVANSGHFSAGFVDRLAELRFSGEVRAMSEGTVFFPDEPILQVIAPLPEAQLIESRLMNILHFQTLIASKAARCRIAAEGRNLVDFGMRRAHGGEAALWAARASYLAGFTATATCLGNARYGIPVTGTMAHSFILAHDSEELAFERFARSHPDNVVLLIDTYDTEAGAHKVVELSRRLAEDGIRVQGVRIDSGDLAEAARRVRRILDAGGLAETRIFVSGGLDEHRIAELVAAGAPIEGFGVGSKVNTSADLAFLDSAYKLHVFDGEARRKHSKSDLPGEKQVFRRRGADGRIAGDVIGLDGETVEGEPLLRTVMDGGRYTQAPETLADARQRCELELAALPPGLRRLDGEGDDYDVGLSPGLAALLERT